MSSAYRDQIRVRDTFIRLELSTAKYPSARQIANVLNTVNFAFIRYLRFNYGLTGELVVAKAEIGSFLATLAAIIEGVDSIPRMQNYLGAFVSNLSVAFEYVRWRGLLPFQRSDSPPPEPDRALVPAIGPLLEAAKGAKSLSLEMELDDQIVRVSIVPKGLMVCEEGTKSIFEGDRAREIMNSDFVIASEEEDIDKVVTEERKKSPNREIVIVTKRNKVKGVARRSMVITSWDSPDYVAARPIFIREDTRTYRLWKKLQLNGEMSSPKEGRKVVHWRTYARGQPIVVLNDAGYPLGTIDFDRLTDMYRRDDFANDDGRLRAYARH